MTEAIRQINKNHNKYIDYYNEIHGEGAYEEKFMYDSEVSDEEENETQYDTENSDIN
jgi:hypothetical protein